MSAGRDRDSGDPFEVLDVGVDHDIDVLGPSHNAPRVDGKAADNHEVDLRRRKTPQQFVEGRFAQARRAAPANRINL